MAPTVQVEALVYLQIEQERELTMGTPAWFAWLETVSTFSFVSKEGLFTARHERTEALGALEVSLTADDLALIERAVLAGAAAGDRYAAPLIAEMDSEHR
jgi:hypothetical protein